MFPKLFKGLYHFTVYAIGILVLTAAVIVTLIRLVLPDIGIYRGEVEAWVSNYMGYPVVIRSLDASWEGWVPHLYLRNIDLMNRAGTRQITHFDSAQIRIAPLDTVIKRRIMPKQLTINGFELAIARLSNGAIYIEGINVSDQQMQKGSENELAEWLFRQEQIRIENGTIEWLDIKHQQAPILLTDVSLTLRSDGKRLQAEGSTSLPSDYGKIMDFAFDAKGDLLSSDWSGELYLGGRNINPENWYKANRPLNFKISGGNADIKVWSTWEHAQLQKLHGQLDYRDFNTSAGKNELNIQELSYNFQGQRLENDGWQFALNLNNFLTDNGEWPQSSINISASRPSDKLPYRYGVAFDYLKLDDLSPFLGSLTFLPAETLSKLSDISIHGALTDGKIIYDPRADAAKKFRFDTEFSDLNTELDSDIPALSNLAGKLYGYMDEGVIELSAGNTRLNSDLLVQGSITLDSMSGKVSWRKNDELWSLRTHNVQILADGLDLTLSGEVASIADSRSPFVDIVATLGETNLEKLSSYLPLTPRFKLRDWMQRAVLGGELSSARALVRGHLSDFPFDEKEGRFLLVADAINGTLDYSQKFPPVDNIDTEIFIDGRSLLAEFRQGNIFNASILEGKAGIADILQKKKTITLSGSVRGSTHDLSLFVEQSPLQKDPNLKEISNSLQAGNFDMLLDMHIPIKQPDNKPDISGSVKLVDTILKSQGQDLTLKNVNGNVAFTHNSVNSEKLDATYHDQPVKLTLSGSKQQADNPPAIRISGRADNHFIADRLIERFPALSSFENYMRDRMSGETEWNLALVNTRDPVSGMTVKSLEMHSNLSGLAIDFPLPVGKKDYQHRNFRVSTLLEQTTDQNKKTHISYDSIFRSELNFQPDKKLQNINLHFGEGDIPDNTSRGLHITGTVDQLNASRWWDIIKERKTDSSDKESFIQSGVEIDLNVASLELLQQGFPDTGISIRRNEENWNFALDGTDISGLVQIPGNRSVTNQISFQLDKLALRQDENSAYKSQAEKIQPDVIPSISGTVTDFSFNQFNLGEMNLQTKPVNNGLSVESITFSKDKLDISGVGEWITNASSDQSNFAIELHADEMETMLTTFNYEQTPVKKGETELTLNANWKGSPMDFSLEKMDGTLNMQISKGQMLDVNPSAGRLFGLFSLQTLSRRLTLDFSDIFGKGLAFDRIEGNFEIEGGNAYTNDLYMKGPSANVSISGRTGLAEQDYDQVVTVTPQLSDNLPVAGVLLGPVGIGLGAVFYLAGQMFDSVHDSIDKLLRYQYTITGSWNQPVIEKIKDKENPSS